jgi:pimeloyl-ACP methyl ester carboxylesterase
VETESKLVQPIVFVHGAWHGAWCWDRVRSRLDAENLPNYAIDLPFTGLDDDGTAVAALVREIGTDVVLCGHSYGARVISRAAQDTGMARHLVYLAGPMVSAGQVPRYHEARERKHPLPYEAFTPDSLRDRFYSETSEPEFQWAYPQIRDMAVRPPDTIGLEIRPWEEVPSTYIVCTRDNTMIAPDLQRMMSSNATYAVELDSDHSPFLSHPDEFTAVLAAIIRTGRPAEARR